MIKKVKTTLILVIIAVVALAGLVPAFLLNYNVYSPDKPIILDDGKNVCISTSYNENFVGYRFKFAEENKEIVVDSTDNIINCRDVIAEGVKVGQQYKVSVCYLGANEGQNSEFSDEIEWTCQFYLSAPIVSYNFLSNVLTCQIDERADFYRVYYSDTSGEKYLEKPALENQVEFDFLSGGQKLMYVVAFSNNPSIKTSQKSNMLEFNLIHYFSEFSSISFDQTSKVLTAENDELLERLEITLSDSQQEKVYSNVKFNVIDSGDSYTYKIDLTTIYNGETIIGISPSDLDEFNLFNGNVKFLEI